MCENCGCTSNQPVRKIGAEESHLHDHYYTNTHEHDHIHEHGHGHYHEHGDGHYHSHPEDAISVMEVRRKNQLQADRNRGMFEAKSILALKITSSQGSGKTMLIDKTIELMKGNCNLFVITDSPETSFDTEVLRETGVKTIDVNTGDGSGGDAERVFKVVKMMDVKDKSILFIENLADVRSSDGSTDLGENRCAVVFGITEGDNKPLKYPELFTGADCCIINKTDLMPYVDFNIEKAKKTILALNPGIKFFEISTKTGEGIDHWVSWVTEEYQKIS